MIARGVDTSPDDYAGDMFGVVDRVAPLPIARPRGCPTCARAVLSGAHHWHAADPTYRCPDAFHTY